MNAQFKRLFDIEMTEEMFSYCRQFPDLESVWDVCPRGDWLLWIAAERQTNRASLVLAACECARLSLHLNKHPSVLTCIKVAEGWCRGEASEKEVGEARKVLYSFVVAANDANNAAHATRSYDDETAHVAAGMAALAAYSAAAAVYLSVEKAGDAVSYSAHAVDPVGTDSAARQNIRHDCAAIVRKYLPKLPL